jgi:hypothetical protein
MGEETRRRAATTFQTGLERRLPVPVRRARMNGLQAPPQACSALHSSAGSDRPAGFSLPCRSHRCARMNAGGGVPPTLPSRITTFAPSLHGGAFLVWLSRAAACPPLNDLARCGALEEDEHAGGGSQLPLLAMPSNLAPLASGTKGDAYGGRSDLGVCGKHARYLSRS